jgi:phytoene dehydrogenase-like protein
LSLHVDLGPDDLGGNGLGLVLALLAARSGFRIPVGGAKAISEALIIRLVEEGGQLRLAARVEDILVREGRAVGVRTHSGEELACKHAILANVAAPTLFLKLLDEGHVAGSVRRKMERFRFGFGTFKMDWALSGPVPWSSDLARDSAVVHTGDSVQDLRLFTQEVRSGQLPANPYLVIGQQSLVDSSRAPEGCHTLWAYSRVPSILPEGWQETKEAFADRIEHRIEGLAPGFRGLILGRAVFSPDELEAMDENLIGGDLGGGSAQIGQQLFFRPMFPYYRYRMPVKGLYLASSYAHPGAGVHGACGFNAARAALQDAGVPVCVPW